VLRLVGSAKPTFLPVRMKSRSKELLSRSVAAMVSAIEIYNKPDFLYREETFSVLAINSWELLLKAKYLKENDNKVNSLYVYEQSTKKDGTKSKRKVVKQTRSGNPFTHSLDYLAKKLTERQLLDNIVWKNIQALSEVRDSSVHFYNRSGEFSLRLQEVGTGTLKNYVALIKDWFGEDFSSYNFYLMPLSFIRVPSSTNAIILSKEEENFIQYVNSLEGEQSDYNDKFSVTVNIDVQFTKSKAREALSVRVTNHQNATEIRYTDEQITEKYPWDYNKLTDKCKERYKDFKVVKKYHESRKELLKNEKYGKTRRLDPSNNNSTKKDFYSPNILEMFDKHYQLK
jgi:Protein of unknown function (DUF3644)/EC042_2821-lke REase